MTRSVSADSAGRTQRRKRRRRTLRQIARTERSARTLLIGAGIGLGLVLSCSFGVEAFWCVPQPLQFVATIVLSGLAGVALGGTIRANRERRALERDGR